MLLKIRILILFSCLTSGFAFAQKPATLTISNSLQQERTDELIVVSRARLLKKFGGIGKNQFINVVFRSVPVLVQYDDLDGDGVWDELVFLKSFKPKEKMTMQLIISNTPAAIKAVVRAHARHKRKNADDTFGPDLVKDSVPAGQSGADFTKVALPPFLTEGPAWENDKVGFRIYFDVRNGKDIWGKTTTKMMMDEVGLDTAHNYHLQADWGMDVLKVGKSLGAGSLALQVRLPIATDTIIRLGNTNMGPIHYEKIADGPVRAIIRLHYPQWKLMDGLAPVSLTEEISIWGGQYFYQSKITVSHAPANAKLITGIVNLYSKSVQPIKNKTTNLIYTYDKQSENKDKLGMSIMLAPGTTYQSRQTPNEGTDVLNTYYIASPVSKARPLVYRFYGAWEKSSKTFTTEAGFKKFLVSQSQQYASPVKLEIK